jgi:hypothetical protein
MKTNMHHYLLDLKVSFVTGFFLFISFSDAEIVMKIIVFLLTVGYTVRRWYLLEKNKKE